MKSGGRAKFNAAEVINSQEQNVKKKIPVSKCPDPNAFLEVTFSYELEADEDTKSEIR